MRRARRYRISRRALATASFLLCAAVLAAGEGPGTFEVDMAALTRLPNRLAGRPEGSLAAGRYVEGRLRDMGVREIFTQEFPVIMPRMRECVAEADGRLYDIHAVRPNLLQASVTPAEGIEGETVYLGRGAEADVVKDPRDKIAVFDFDCGKNWLTAFARGAKAVLFIENGESPARPLHHVRLPANLPRFFVPEATMRELGLDRQPRRLRIRAACEWEALRGRNIVGIIRGTNAARDVMREAVLVAAPLDAYSEVPELAVGAHEAANAAALLRVAEYLVNHKPERDVIVAFFDGQALDNSGARAFYGALHRRMGIRKLAESLETRLEMATKEETYVREVLAVTGLGDIFTPQAKALNRSQDVFRMARSVAFAHSGSIMQQLAPLRIEVQKLKLSKAADSPETRAALDRLSPEGPSLGDLDRLQMDELAWNSVVRCMNDQRPPDDARIRALSERLVTDRNPERLRLKKELFERKLKACLREAVREVQRNGERRLDELRVRKGDVAADMRLRDALDAEKETIVLHISLNLGDAGASWSFAHGDDLGAVGQDSEGLYTSHYRALRDTARALGGDVPGFDPRPVSDLYPSRLFTPALLADSGAIARLFAHFNLSVITVFDPLMRRGLPADRLEAMHVANVSAQAEQLAPFLRALVMHEALSRAFPNRAEAWFDEERWSGTRSSGHLTRLGDMGDPLQTAALPGAIVAALPESSPSAFWEDVFEEKVPAGFRRGHLVRSQSNGIFEMPAIRAVVSRGLFAACFDEAPEGSRGLITRVTASSDLVTPLSTKYLNMAKVQPLTLVGSGYERAGPTIVMRALSTSRMTAGTYLACEGGSILCLFAPFDSPCAKIFNAGGMVVLDNKPTDREHYGRGIPMSNAFERISVPDRTSADLLNLNTYRLGLLSTRGISEDSLETLNGRANDLREDAAAVRGESAEHYYSMLEASVAYSRRVHGPLVGAMNDLVAALVLLLLLSLPFAFALERLLIGSPHVYRRLGWFALFFAITFALLYSVNPAFKLAATPVIIFLAFAVILLSVMVIFIMTRKLQTELKRLQGLSATAHSVDVSRVSTMMAAVSMGISTMRRRPVRTILTAVTAVLLTFTLLTFASFSSVWGNLKTYVRPLQEGPPRIMVRTLLWSPLARDTLITLRGYLTGRAEVVPRYWVAPTLEDVADSIQAGKSLDIAAATEGGGKLIPMSAAIGIDPREWRMDSSIRSCFDERVRFDLLEADGIAISQAASETLHLAPADVGKARIVFKGKPLVYAGCFNRRLWSQAMLDGSSQLPVDFRSSFASGSTEAMPTKDHLLAAGKTLSFVPYPEDAVAVMSSAVAAELGGSISALTVYPADPGALKTIAEDVAVITGHPTYVGSEGGVNRLLFSVLVRASGFRDLLIPVVLGGLIIFATMLGSVADREREIYTFSSLGLAPPHVAMLFFAESAIYAIIGGMGGYLLGQLSVSGLSWASRFAHVAIPTMNFSSMNAVTTIFIVMAIVMLSTLYPALRASKSANPGLQRSWSLPRPKGDRYDIRFPFTVSEYDLIGITSYIEEHFRNFADAAIGSFATLQCEVFRQEENDMLGFSATVVLAPFDLGIEQEVILLSQPSDVEGIDEVRLMLRRTNGSYGDWQRANRQFVSELRRQFLIWRTLESAAADVYRERTLSRWNQLTLRRGADLQTGGDAGAGA